MRIVNVLNRPRYFSYGSTGKGGKALQSGDKSAELNLEAIHNPLLWSDIKNGVVQVILSTDDKEFLGKVLTEGSREIVVEKPKPIPVKPKPKAKAKPKIVPISRDPMAGVHVPAPAANLPKKYTMEDVIAGKVSIKELNRVSETPADIARHKSKIPSIDSDKQNKL